ncbi:MAG: preprotein translocase subunit Sec61beta [Candidatus Woesearchaeota archaeon]
MAKNNIQMPQSGAGLTRFTSSDLSIIKIRPAHVVLLLIIVVLVVVFLHIQGNSLFNVPQLFLGM